MLLADEIAGEGGAAALKLEQVLSAFPGGRAALGQLDIKPRLQQALAGHRELQQNRDNVAGELHAATVQAGKAAAALSKAEQQHAKSQERLRAAQQAAQRHDRIRSDLEVLQSNETARHALEALGVIPAK